MLQSSTMVIGATVSSSSQEGKKMAQLSAINLILISFYLNNSSIPGIIGISILLPHQALLH
jgi:hypothetical protein